MRLGIFGGTFDPFTKAHCEIVNKAFSLVDGIIIIPTTISYYRDGKTPLFNFDQKIEIINAYIDKFWADKWITVSDLEKGRNSFWRTADTVRELRKTYIDDEFYFILGSDSFNDIETWSEYEFLKDNLKFIVVDGRDGVPTVNKLPHEKIEISLTGISASKVREQMVDKMLNDYIRNI